MVMQFKQIDSQALIVPDSDALARVTAQLLVLAFRKILSRKSEVLFIPSSGHTPRKTYKLLALRYKTAVDWSRITIIQMDEYYSNNLSSGAYFNAFLQQHLVEPLGIGRFVSMRNSGVLASPEDYTRTLEDLGPIDFALHGIGTNGHIGFNEPGSSARSLTRIVRLADDTRRANFPAMAMSESPKYGLTMGLAQLQAVKHTLLIATGAQKMPVIQNLMRRAVVDQTPASILWESPDFGLIVDSDAANLSLSVLRA